MRYKLISAKVQAILNKVTELTLPVQIDDIARAQGLRVMPYPLEEEVSGVLVIENDLGTIGYNQNESRVRRRFTIAHELGHFELHKNIAPMFIDKQFKIYRRQNSAADPIITTYEQEANAFAAELLMPEALIMSELENTNIDLGNEEGLKNLAKTFDVSSTAMYYRLTNLKLI